MATVARSQTRAVVSPARTRGSVYTTERISGECCISRCQPSSCALRAADKTTASSTRRLHVAGVSAERGSVVAGAKKIYFAKNCTVRTVEHAREPTTPYLFAPVRTVGQDSCVTSAIVQQASVADAQWNDVFALAWIRFRLLCRVPKWMATVGRWCLLVRDCLHFVFPGSDCISSTSSHVTPNQNPQVGGLSTPLIIAITVILILVLGSVVIAVLCYRRRRRKRESKYHRGSRPSNAFQPSQPFHPGKCTAGTFLGNTNLGTGSQEKIENQDRSVVARVFAHGACEACVLRFQFRVVFKLTRCLLLIDGCSPDNPPKVPQKPRHYQQSARDSLNFDQMGSLDNQVSCLNLTEVFHVEILKNTHISNLLSASA